MPLRDSRPSHSGALGKDGAAFSRLTMLMVFLLLGSALLTSLRGSNAAAVPQWQALGPRSISDFGDASRAGLLLAGKIQALAVYNSNPSIIYAGGGMGPGNSGPISV